MYHPSVISPIFLKVIPDSLKTSSNCLFAICDEDFHLVSLLSPFLRETDNGSKESFDASLNQFVARTQITVMNNAMP